MHKTFLLSLSTCAALAGETLLAQDTVPDMVTDRPDQTESTSIVPSGWLQVELGVQSQRTTVSANGTEATQTDNALPDALLRFGVLPTMELRLKAGYGSTDFQGATTSGMGPLTLGAKIAVCGEDGLRPEIAFLGHITLPNTGADEFSAPYLAPDFLFSMSHTLSDALSLGYNIGAEWDGESAMAAGLYSASLGISVSDNIGVFAELFGNVTESGDNATSFDAGATYAILPNVQIDASGGVGLSDLAPDYFVGAGLSFRLPR